MTPDPLGGNVADPQSLNRYSYVLNNPETLTDPSGLQAGLSGKDTCTVDGINTPCDDAMALIHSGAACLGSCSTPVVGSNGVTYQATQTAGPTVYIAPNGEELSDSSIAELGLPPLDQFGGMGMGLGPGGLGVGDGNSAGAGPRAVAGCPAKILGAVNNHFGTNFTSSNVTGEFQYAFGAPPGQGTLNLNVSVPSQGQPSGVSPGRYPVSWWTYIIGYGSTLHIPAGPGGLDGPLTLPFSNSQFTVHLDSAFPYNPIGLVVHEFEDVEGIGGFPKCP